MCIPKIRLISRVPKNVELIDIHWAISELEHADRNDRRRTKSPSRRAESGAQNTYHRKHWRTEHTPQFTLTHRTHTTVHTGAQNTHHSPYWRTEHTPQSTLTHRTHTTVHTDAQNTHHSPYWRTEHTPQSTRPSQAANELEWSPTASVCLLRKAKILCSWVNFCSHTL